MGRRQKAVSKNFKSNRSGQLSVSNGVTKPSFPPSATGRCPAPPSNLSAYYRFRAGINLINPKMACCASDDETKEAARRSRLIDRQLAQEKRNLRQEIKILLLGAGESGKTTFLKQMRIIHGEDYSEQDRLEFRSSIYHNILKGMKILVEARRRLQIPLSNPQCDEYSQVITNYHRTGEITPEDFQEYTGALGTLWKDAGIRETEKRKNEFQLVSIAHVDKHRLAGVGRAFDLAGRSIPPVASSMHVLSGCYNSLECVLTLSRAYAC